MAGDRWSSAPDLPEPRHHPGVTTIGGRVFVIGGFGVSETATVYAFDPGTGLWEARRPLPRPRAAHVSVELGGKIYSIGGVSDGAAVGTTEVYDPLNDAWTMLAPMPTPREHLAAAVIGERILAVGGRAASNTERSRPTAPRPTRGSGSRPCPRRAEGSPPPSSRSGYTSSVARAPASSHTPKSTIRPQTAGAASRICRRRAMGWAAVSVAGVIHVIGGATREGFGATGAPKPSCRPLSSPRPSLPRRVGSSCDRATELASIALVDPSLSLHPRRPR